MKEKSTVHKKLPHFDAVHLDNVTHYLIPLLISGGATYMHAPALSALMTRRIPHMCHMT
jgi:hypothetical protein